MKYNNVTAEELIINLGLEKLDEVDKNAIKNMFLDSYISIGFNANGKSHTGSLETTVANAGIYTQNYIIIKQLLRLQEQNRQIIDQNNKVIELLTKISEK